MLRKMGGRVAARPKQPWTSRRRCVTNTCASMTAVLLLLSLFLLHSRLSTEGLKSVQLRRSVSDDGEGESLLKDQKKPEDDDDWSDRIDQTDEMDEKDVSSSDPQSVSGNAGYFWDHASGTVRREFKKGGVMDDDEWAGRTTGEDDRSKVAFGSDDQPVDEEIRDQLSGIKGVEDALLLNKRKNKKSESGSTSLEWSAWSDKVLRQSAKGYFPLRDEDFRSSMEALNPLNHPLLQDPDSPGVTGLTRSDRIVKKSILNKVQPVSKKVERRKVLEEPQYADGRKWGFFPGLNPHLGFSRFMEEFFQRGNCSLKFFMVWNTEPWAFTIRHQRGLESILYHHPDACVVMFSETLELNFFQDFVKDGYKIATVMPDLDQLLKGTPTHIFASVWHKWKEISLYHIHYSELVRFAALYKYGGIYVDSDVIILKPLHSLSNSVGLENMHSKVPSLNGAVMVFQPRSPFILECLKEFFTTYDDSLRRWNGAELLSRTAARFVKAKNPEKHVSITMEPTFRFFPISSQDITRYFEAPSDEDETIRQEILFRIIINESYAFHFWNGVTFSLVPQPESVAEKILNRHCLRCQDVL